MDFDLGNLGMLMGGMQQRIAAMKEKAAKTECTGEAGGGLVKITLTGDYNVSNVVIGEGAMEDRELLEDLMRAALGDALGRVRGELASNMKEATGGLPIPPGLLPF